MNFFFDLLVAMAACAFNVGLVVLIFLTISLLLTGNWVLVLFIIFLIWLCIAFILNKVR